MAAVWKLSTVTAASSKSKEKEEQGLIFEYMEKGIPVIDLLSIKKICQMNSIAFDPVPLPSSSSFVYSSVSYNKALIILTLLFAFSILRLGVISSKKAKCLEELWNREILELL